MKQEKSKSIASYITESAQNSDQYKNDVESGLQVACRWIKLAVQRSRKDFKRSDIIYKQDAVNRVYEFFYFLRISTGEGYKRFELSPYQAWIISEIFGWFFTSEENKRRYRYATIFTGRKSGKTMFSVGIELYILMYDNQTEPEAYLCATTREQAGQALKYSKAVVKHSPALRRRLRVQQFQILYPKRDGLLKVLANKPDKNDSLSPSIFILDEKHAFPTLDFFNVMKSGTLFRKNPLGLSTSTAGFNKDYPFYTELQTAQKVLEGIVDDDITFYALYTLDDDDDVEDTTAWIKPNPNIGVTINLQDLINEYKKAKLTITERNNFITKNLNRYLDNLEQWIPDEVYVTCFDDINPPVNERVPAFIGLDISATRDLAALVIVWTDEATGKLAVYPEFYFPQNEVKRIRESGIDLGEWINKGFIIEHNRPTIDQTAIVERIKYWNTVFKLQMMYYDKWNSGYIVPELETSIYLYCEHFNQETKWFNFPLKYIERQFFEQNISMSTNPVMRWMFRNIQLYYDGNGNIKIMKNKSMDSVDGPVALGMAVGAWLKFNGDVTAAFFKELTEQNNKNN